MKRTLKIMGMLLMVAVMVGLSSCSNKSKLVGFWKMTGEDVFLFLDKDGTAYQEEGDRIKTCQWSTHGDKIMIDEMEFKFRLDKDRLTIFDEKGEVASQFILLKEYSKELSEQIKMMVKLSE